MEPMSPCHKPSLCSPTYKTAVLPMQEVAIACHNAQGKLGRLAVPIPVLPLIPSCNHLQTELEATKVGDKEVPRPYCSGRQTKHTAPEGWRQGGASPFGKLWKADRAHRAPSHSPFFKV